MHYLNNEYWPYKNMGIVPNIIIETLKSIGQKKFTK